MSAVRMLSAVTILVATCGGAIPAGAQAPDKAAAAEAALTDCRLEESLRLWREVLRDDPNHARAKYVVGKLTAQALDLDSHLDVIDTLVEKGVTEGTSDLLDAAARRAATDAQKARILYLRGRLARARNDDPRSRAAFETAVKLYPNTECGARSAIALGESEPVQAAPGEAQRLLQAVIGNARLPAAVRQAASLKLLAIESKGWTPQRRIAAVRELLKELTAAGVKRQALRTIIELIADSQGRWTPEAVDAAGAALGADPPYDEAASLLRELFVVAQTSQDAPTVDAVLNVLAAAKLKHAPLVRQVRFALAEALISRAVLDQDPAAMTRRLGEANRVLDALVGEQPTPGETKWIWEVRGRLRRVEAQKLLALAGPTRALPAVIRAKDHYLAALPSDPEGCLERLSGIGRLLEHVHEWETAVGLYREISAAYPHAEQGRDALLRVARLHDARLNDPVAALDVYAEYAARYPAELAYRQMNVGERLRRLGYANVLDFQKRMGLKPDGIFGPKTRTKLEEMEGSFDAIRVDGDPDDTARPEPHQDEAHIRIGFRQPPEAPPTPPTPWWGPASEEAPASAPARERPVSRRQAVRLRGREADSPILRGTFVHPTMFGIARRLAEQGRHHDAVRAYLLLLNLFPTKRQADDALLAVARIFRDNFLFEEALGAYAELMEYFPKGDQTSEAYIEAAACLENLGRWDKARELYELYLKKFPKYKHVALCKQRMELLDDIRQYQQFLQANADHPKAPEAQYQIAVILYKQLHNPTKAAVEFTKVAQRHPKHVRAADGLYTAGTAYLHTENFPAARKAFEQVVANHPESRLADDAQYWIGHTHEYAARALGKLDKKRIVLKQRGGRARQRLLADLALRRRYHPQAQPGPGMPEDVWTADALGVLTSGSKRDRVNAELFRAIAAYRKVVEKFKMGDMAGSALHRIAVIHTTYLKDPDKGFQAYQELLANYPGTRQAVDALYEVGAYHLKKKQHDKAVQAYRQFCFNYPNDKRVQDAMLAVARCHMETKAYDKALDAYQSYLSKFPDGKHADFAKAQIAWIRTYHY